METLFLTKSFKLVELMSQICIKRNVAGIILKQGAQLFFMPQRMAMMTGLS